MLATDIDKVIASELGVRRNQVAKAIELTMKIQELEDLYLPYKEKRRVRADVQPDLRGHRRRPHAHRCHATRHHHAHLPHPHHIRASAKAVSADAAMDFNTTFLSHL